LKINPDLQKYLKFDGKFGFKGLFVMEKLPHTIGN
jgi:hypothetical protein